jgi:rRNA-processing protein EBP2
VAICLDGFAIVWDVEIMAKQATQAARGAGKPQQGAKGKGKGKAQVPVPLPAPVEAVSDDEDDDFEDVDEDEDEDEDEYDSDEDSETGGVSQRGFEALIKALGPEGVKAAQEEMAGAGDEDDEDMEDDEDEEDDEEVNEDPITAASNAIAAAEEEQEIDSDALELDDVGSEFSIDEDAVPVRKVTINNRVSRDNLIYRTELTFPGRNAGVA